MEHRALAWVVRALVVAAPIGSSWFATRMLHQAYWRPAGGFGFLIWVAQVLVVGSAVVLLTGRAARRFLPLAALLNLALVFPDEAPSRFRVALRSGTIRNLEEQLADVRAHGFGATEAQAAQRVIELVTALGRHERLTRGHTERVRAYTDLIGAEMGLPAEDRDRLRWASFLHDIGKLAVPAEILNKPGKPTEEEWATLQSHPVVGGELVEPLAGWLGEWRHAASQHHERWDGTGYPNRLAGTDISLAGRIVAVADAYDVITSARSYKKPMTAVAARAELVRCAGTQFDPAIVRTFLTVSLGDRGSRAGALGWLAELARTVATSAAQTTSAAGTIVAASAVASATAVGTLGSAGGPPPTDVVAAPKIVSEVMDHDRAPRVTAAGDGRAAAAATVGVAVTSDPAPTSSTSSLAPPVVDGQPRGPSPTATAPPADTIGSPGSVGSSTTTAGAVPNTSPPSTAAAPTTTAAQTTTAPPSAPVARDDDAVAGAGATVTVDVLANDTDPDDDLDPATLAIIVSPSKGTATVVDGVIVFTADATANGTVNIRYRICDLGGRCATARLQVKRS